MTKDNFYRNCLTPEGREKNVKYFNQGLKHYYKNNDIDITNVKNWNEIVYIPIHGRENIDDETISEELQQQDWDIWTMADIMINLVKRQGMKDTIIQDTIHRFNILSGEPLFRFI